MTHRGPDDRGTYTAPGVALGVRRLSIVDVDGRPPADLERDRVGLGDAERRALQPSATPRRARGATAHRFGPALRHRGPPAPLRATTATFFPSALRGMFGVAVWDRRERRAVVARDRLGIKPLYYAQRGDLLVFASELKSLLASGARRVRSSTPRRSTPT